MDENTSSDLFPKRVLFVCTGNTCRSVLAEYIARYRFGTTLSPTSAGIRPQAAVDAFSAIETLRDVGIDASHHVPQGLEAVHVEGFDYVIAMEPDVARRLKGKFPSLPANKLITWKVDDPWDDPAAYKRCAEQIHALLGKLRLKIDGRT